VTAASCRRKKRHTRQRRRGHNGGGEWEGDYQHVYQFSTQPGNALRGWVIDDLERFSRPFFSGTG